MTVPENLGKNEPGAPDEIVIRPAVGFSGLALGDLYRTRFMLWSMVRRQVKTEFNELYLSVLWAVARPLAVVSVFILLKGLSGARMGVEFPYPIYVYSGLIVWFYFVDSIQGAAASIRRDAGLMKKIHYPRLLSPTVPVLANLVRLGVAAVPLVVMMFYYDLWPGWALVLLPLVVADAVFLALGVGTVFAALSLDNRDWQNFLSLVLYVGLFVSPVIFGPDMIPAKAQWALHANPASGMLLAFRAVLFADFPFPLYQWLYSLIISAGFLVGGVLFFQSVEKRIVDEL